MPWSAPVAPVAGTVITVAWATANVVNPINWLRQVTGNADPPGSNYAIRSLTTTTTDWSKVTNDMLASGAAAANLGYTPVNKAGDSGVGALSMGANISFPADGRGIFLNQGGTLVDFDTAGTTLFAGDNAFRLLNQAGSVVYLQVTASSFLSKGSEVWTDANTNGRVTAAKIQTPLTSSLTFTGDGIGIFLGSGGTLVDFAGAATTLFAAENAFRVLREDGGAEIFRAADADAAPTFHGFPMWHAGNDGASSTLDAGLLGGVGPAGYAAASHSHGTSGNVPLGAVVWFETLAELTAAGASWARYTAADGRLLVGAGASASAQTFSQATNYGVNWTPASGVGVSDGIGISDTLGITVGSLDVGGSLGSSDSNNFVSTTTATINMAHSVHSHSISGLSVTGAPGRSGGVTKSGTVSATGTGTVWLPYMRAGIWGRRIS